jgi:hypothetical protein
MYSLVNVLSPTAVSMLPAEGSDIAKSLQSPSEKAKKSRKKKEVKEGS